MKPHEIAILSLGALLVAVTTVTAQQASAAPEAGTDDAGLVQQLMQADRDFASSAERSGIEGWVSWFAEDGVRLALPGPIARGHEEIREMDGPLFADRSIRLRWEPTDAGLFRGEDHGFTRGRYSLVRLSPGGEETQLGRGTYLSIWRRDADGWRVILDTGTADPELSGDSQNN